MDKLKKLNAKKVESLDAIKGGRALSMSNDLSADTGDGSCTITHYPTHFSGPDVYLCDHKHDEK
ncbi:hypothetical protein EGT74_18005 [Chitinophaga lutea]|uniref:Uncharacterized protein n=1 Tax=Chitinophaga lutea TaxID=2488634 RepID=A0A3N4PJR8_9BACT|nr:hypothetical protein [Chitinophaga lutea]RPE08912.1 hypothetical protein EGT74_18005 [Chitinophaga lutea]